MFFLTLYFFPVNLNLKFFYYCLSAYWKLILPYLWPISLTFLNAPISTKRFIDGGSFFSFTGNVVYCSKRHVNTNTQNREAIGELICPTFHCLITFCTLSGNNSRISMSTRTIRPRLYRLRLCLTKHELGQCYFMESDQIEPVAWAALASVYS